MGKNNRKKNRNKNMHAQPTSEHAPSLSFDDMPQHDVGVREPKRMSATSDKGSSRKNVLIALVLGFIIGFGFHWLIANGGNDAPDEVLEDTGTTTDAVQEDTEEAGFESPRDIFVPKAPLPTSDEVIIDDQTAGADVLISRVSLTKTGWIAIRDYDNGMIGNILGAKRFDAGTSAGVMTLLRPTVSGQEYRIVLYHDDGDGEFDFTRDTLIENPEVSAEQMTFTTF